MKKRFSGIALVPVPRYLRTLLSKSTFNQPAVFMSSLGTFHPLFGESPPSSSPLGEQNHEQEKSGDVFVLSEEDVRKVLTLEQAMMVNAKAFRSLALGKAIVPTRLIVNEPQYDGCTLYKPATVEEHTGMKLIAVRPKNSERKPPLPTLPGTIFMLDQETGLLKGIVAATFLTAIRTAAGSGVATHLFARADCRVLTILGCGLQAEQHIHAMILVRPTINTVYLLNRTLARAEELKAKIKLVYPHVIFQSVELKEGEKLTEALKKADIICTTTNSSTPLFSDAHISVGVHLNCVGGYGSMQEIDSKVVARGRIVLDSDDAKNCGDIATPIRQELMTKDAILGTIGEFIPDNFSLFSSSSSPDKKEHPSNKKLKLSSSTLCEVQVRRSAEDITIFKSVGTAVQDIATAALAMEEAKRKKVGTTIGLF